LRTRRASDGGSPPEEGVRYPRDDPGLRRTFGPVAGVLTLSCWPRSLLRLGITGVVCCQVRLVLLVGDSAGDDVRSWWLTVLTVPAVRLDAADGKVARAAGVCTPAGAALDLQADAVLLLEGDRSSRGGAVLRA